MAGGDEFTFAPLGGVGEIGMNLSIYEFGSRQKRAWLAVTSAFPLATKNIFRASTPSCPTSVFW